MKLVKFLYIGAGLLSMALGFLGMFLPILPTTPFLLLASFCFARSSGKLHYWLMNHRVFGKYITNYLTHKAIPVSSKVWIIVLLWSSMLVSMLMVGKMIVTIILIAIGLGVSYHILTLRTLKQPNHNDPLNVVVKNNESGILQQKEISND